MRCHYRLLRRVFDAEGQPVPSATLPDHADLLPGVFEVQSIEDGQIRRVSGRNETELATAVAMQNWCVSEN